MTESPIDRLTEELGRLADAWSGTQPAPGWSAASEMFEAASGSGLVRVLAAAGRMRRALDAFMVRAADEVAKRSAAQFGAEGLAKQQGFASPARLVAAVTGGAQSEAARWLAVGEATRRRIAFSGDTCPARCEQVRVALDEGEISTDAAAAITGMLRRAERRADAALLGPYEHQLVQFAAGQPLKLVTRAVALAEARLDPDGAAPADEQRYADRGVTLVEDGTGMLRLHGRLDPISAAPIKAAFDAFVSDALRARGSAPALAGGGDPAIASSAGPAMTDQRSVPRLNADALTELAKHALGCRSAPGALPRTTVVVRLSLEALREGVGLAEIDGIDQPIAAGSVRRLAADAEVIPAVLGTDRVPLDLGRSARLFSPAQRLALLERDGGCASCGANVTYAEAHHIEWWARDAGATDLANGVMLCSSCHHRVHDQGWGIRADGSRVWFIPPPHVDPAQVPRLGGRARFEPPPVPAPPAHGAAPPDGAGARDPGSAGSGGAASAGSGGAASAGSGGAASAGSGGAGAATRPTTATGGRGSRVA